MKICVNCHIIIIKSKINLINSYHLQNVFNIYSYTSFDTDKEILKM